MNTDNNQKKQFTELSDEDLKNVNGGMFLDENSNYACLIPIDGCPVGEIYTSVDGKCQCVPVPNP